MNIRPIQPDDASAAVQLIRSTLEGSDQEHYPTSTLEFLTEFFSSDATLQQGGQRYCLVAEAEGLLVGAVALDDSELVTFIVHPKHQRQGVGQALLQGIEAESRLRQLDRLTIATDPSMVDFFKKYGYARSGQIISMRGVQVGLEKPLRP